MHKQPKRFGFSGKIDDDSSIPRLREEYERLILEEMEETGYVPILDFGPFFSTELSGGNYKFIISMFGMYVGRKKVCQYMGVDSNGRLYPKTSQKAKSNTC